MTLIEWSLVGLFGIPAYAIMLRLTYDFICSKMDLFKK